ncbi:T9SS type A sorting domain-containing protein [bacterium]|nr:T9SS type A sorting domain-containing protein [bacterium]
MKSTHRIILSIVLLFSSAVFITHQVNAGLLYYSQLQRGADNNLVSLPPGNFYGHIHSDDYFQFAYKDSIFGVISSHQDCFFYDHEMSGDSIYIEHGPLFDMPEMSLLRGNLEHLRGAANPWISDRDGEYMTRIWLKGERGITIYQYEIGLPAPELYDPGRGAVNFHELAPQQWGAIFVDGQCEIYGEHAGTLTIGSSGDMWLVDNITITENDWYRSVLGLVSERNIIIKDNTFNGRNNGFGNYSPNQSDYHSISIEAGLMALGGSLKIEHTNADWEHYQGPSPDQRGIIHLNGALYQREASPLYYENHGGTGYSVDFHYDENFDYFPPPYFPGYQMGYFFISQDVVYRNNLVVFSGTEIFFLSYYRYTIEGSLRMYGTDQRPIHVSWLEDYPGDTAAVFAVNWGSFPKVHLKHAHFEEGVDVDFFADSTWIDSCTFDGNMRLRGNYVEVTNSHFTGDVKLDAAGHTVFNHNIVEGRLKVDGNNRTCRIFNNTIVNPDGDGVFLDRYRSVELNSNIIAFCERGIVKDFWNEVDLRYNNVFGSSETDYFEIEPGEGSISADPRFVNAENGDYHLEWNSPCIDAGDPELQQDPDGTRADMGAYFHHRLKVDKDEDALIPTNNLITVSPNPFNSQVRISYRIDRPDHFKFSILDQTGRLLVVQQDKSNSIGEHTFVWNAENYPSGIYFVRLEMVNGIMLTQKMVLVR